MIKRPFPFALIALTGLSVCASPAHSQTPPAPLAPVEVTSGDSGWETDPAHIPGYLLALAVTQPQTVQPFAKLLRVTLTRGRLTPATKAAMGYVIARQLKNEYAERHLARLLNTNEQGKGLLAALGGEKDDGGKIKDERDRIAVQYASRLTRDVHGIDNAFFPKVRAVFNDSEIVELTQTVCTMNYFVRLCAATGLTPEPYLATTTPKPLPDAPAVDFGRARVTLATDPEMEWGGKLIAPTNGDPWGLGIKVFNSQRAMLRSPELGGAWMDYWQSVRAGAKVPRSTLLQVSFAVSTANGCRYCTVHQVVGLRREKVEIAKLLAMQKSDDSLTPSEKAAVTFARKLTKTPPQVTKADFAALQTAFPDSQAMEIIMQTCAFSYMNRFTDNLGLPSEDEAVHVYKEVYGDKGVVR